CDFRNSRNLLPRSLIASALACLFESLNFLTDTPALRDAPSTLEALGGGEHHRKVQEGSTMAQAKRSSKRNRRKISLPAVGAAGVSLALTGGASAAPVPVMDQSSYAYLPGHEVTLGEEEMSDVSLATFYVFDQESRKSITGELQLAARCGRCGGRC